MGADYSFYFISIETYAPQFNGHNKKFLSSVRRQLGGGGEGGQKLAMDSTNKLLIWGREVSKIQKNCRRILWMVPIQELKLNSQWPHCFYGVVFDFLKRVYDFKR